MSTGDTLLEGGEEILRIKGDRFGQVIEAGTGINGGGAAQMDDTLFVFDFAGCDITLDGANHDHLGVIGNGAVCTVLHEVCELLILFAGKGVRALLKLGMGQDEDGDAGVADAGELIVDDFNQAVRAAVVAAEGIIDGFAGLAGFTTGFPHDFIGGDIKEGIKSIKADTLDAIVSIVFDQIIDDLNKAAVAGFFIVIIVPGEGFFDLEVVEVVEAGLGAAGDEQTLGALPQAARTRLRHQVVLPNLRGDSSM